MGYEASNCSKTHPSLVNTPVDTNVNMLFENITIREGFEEF